MTKERMKYIGSQILGWFFIILGIIGLFLPVLQGVIFLMLGFLILSKTSPWAKRKLDQFEKRHPLIAKQMNRLRKHPRLKRILP
ncbi:hypothetical protein SAMN05444487_101329 [Marininema mesophilum]|uniref:Transmembrane protein (PGPGW) n=1 Tax=Marininema mesophilum TaxID=1048340 RepID=A0A1H2QYF6_9BACL|nr:DUF454 family protein [Marininema mesophilum]SDW11968.1 hypothetical protein SAMN05444487_101329 [Marininema mesophilum]